MAPPPPPIEPGDPDQDPFCAFWTGDDPRVHAELCALLDEEHIPYRTLRRQDHLFNINTKNAFTLGIPFSHFERAENAVKEAYGSDDADSESESTGQANPFALAEKPAGQSTGAFPNWLAAARNYAARFALGPGQSQGAAEAEEEIGLEASPSDAGWDPDDWFPEGATVEVWSGSPPEMADLLFAALRENCIHVRRDTRAASESLFVLPQDEVQAREIVRQILEGTAPE
ncbi:MAG TPA: hypothetical protein VJP87_02685 [Candidatus Acidoferrales bacterium]|nr:hypothetical protein [Candidatus Acidoferrales bacterium]